MEVKKMFVVDDYDTGLDHVEIKDDGAVIDIHLKVFGRMVNIGFGGRILPETAKKAADTAELLVAGLQQAIETLRKKEAGEQKE